MGIGFEIAVEEMYLLDDNKEIINLPSPLLPLSLTHSLFLFAYLLF